MSLEKSATTVSSRLRKTVHHDTITVEMKSATPKSIFGRSSEGSWKAAGVTMAPQATTARAIAARGARRRLNDLASARPFASVFVPTEPWTLRTVLSPWFKGGEVREGNAKRHSLGDVGRIEDSRSGRKPFPVECDLTTPRIRLTRPVTSPASSRRVDAVGRNSGAVTGHQQVATNRN